MSKTTKNLAKQDGFQVLKAAFNENDHSITTGGFLIGKVGRKITQVISTTTISNDTETFTFIEDDETLYALKIIYTDGTRETMLSAERIE